MRIEKAKKHYKGNGGAGKLNCAQAIIAAFGDKFSVSDHTIKIFAAYGAGMAPGGECGTFCAAKFLLSAKHKDMIGVCEEMFKTEAGSAKCKEIRAIKKLPCLGCVEKIAEFLEKI